MTDDKFILMGIDDDRSKDIAEVLSNKTCKKILDHLSEAKEASEKEISDSLKMPINTVEYNLNKLIKSGLVEKTKNFFWSVKGKKIEMYKLAKKHIIISPSSKKLALEQLKMILPIIFIALAIILISGILFFNFNRNVSLENRDSNLLKNFNSQQELEDFIKANSENRTYSYEESFAKSGGVPAQTSSAAESTNSGSSARLNAGEYSKTNIQVEGVDEPDIVKNDGKYIYTLSNEKVVIVEAYPAEYMKILSNITVNSAINMFINENKLIVFASEYNYVPYEQTAVESTRCFGKGCYGYSQEKTIIYTYDITDKKNPKLINNFSIEGDYHDSRMINNYVYLISSKYVYNDPIPPIYTINNVETKIPATEVNYFDYYDESYSFTTITSYNLDNNEYSSKVYLLGRTGTIYVSLNNIYLTHRKTLNQNNYTNEYVDKVALKLLPEKEQEFKNIIESNDPSYIKQKKINEIIYSYSISLSGEEKNNFDSLFLKLTDEFSNYWQKQTERTVIHKISVDNGMIVYENFGEVFGHLLNQFSIDEYGSYLRIATTSGEVWNSDSLNHVYVLDKNLKLSGSLENIAPGEKIYSTRFIGKRVYMVTFKKVDPFYVIDISNPNSPKILGYLKIPGYSDYLHPYDENHIIGIGKNAVDASELEANQRNLDFAWYQGMKISIFDVSDVNNPIEKAKYLIGERGTESLALYDHKAFLFDKQKQLLVIPVTISEINRSRYRSCNEQELNSYNSYNYCLTPNTYGESVFQGALVFNIKENEITLKNKITHFDNVTRDKYGWKFYDYNYQVQRSLFMDDILYTISNSKIKANSLISNEEINKLDLPVSNYNRYYVD
jgi:uncharacterized secreted protein with C-terminal beta-propeller domain